MHAGPIPEFWALLTEEQKRKVAVMEMDRKIQWLKVKIHDMEKTIELKKKAIADIRKVQEMMK
jgi:predicted 2-oxoglutarate/Fe(II)-dependent dioxygenase YbiX